MTGGKHAPGGRDSQGRGTKGRRSGVVLPEEVIGFVLPDRKGIGRLVASYAAKQAGYDDRPPYQPPRPFTAPEAIAALVGARPKGRGWKRGLCPICGERTLSIWWGRHRDKTMVKCNAANHCPQIDVVKAISKLHCISLDLRPSTSERKPRRRLSETKGLPPIERALWHCTRAERRLYQFLKKRGDGTVRFEDMPLGKNAGRGVPALEHLGLVKARRGRFDPYGGGRIATSYEIARLKLLHPLEGDDRKLEADLKAIRKANMDLNPALKQNIKNASQAYNRRTSSKHTLKMTAIRTESHVQRSRAAPSRQTLTRAEQRRRRRAARFAGAMVFAKAVGEMALAHGGSWVGTWREMLAAVSRPIGCRAWPLSRQGVMASVWLGREALRAMGLQHCWAHVDTASGRRVLRAIRIIPAPIEEASRGLATG